MEIMVIGASQGLGRALVTALASDGHQLTRGIAHGAGRSVGNDSLHPLDLCRFCSATTGSRTSCS